MRTRLAGSGSRVGLDWGWVWLHVWGFLALVNSDAEVKNLLSVNQSLASWNISLARCVFTAGSGSNVCVDFLSCSYTATTFIWLLFHIKWTFVQTSVVFCRFSVSLSCNTLMTWHNVSWALHSTSLLHHHLHNTWGEMVQRNRTPSLQCTSSHYYTIR